MSIVDKIKSAVGSGDESTTKRRYRCAECEAEFESYKASERASCRECMSNDVELVEKH